MLPNFARHIFYKLHHTERGPGRWLANAMSYGFMGYVRLTGRKPKMDMTPLLIISHKYKFIYIGIPKTATRSMRDAFHGDNASRYGTEIYETRPAFFKALEDYPDYYKFSFVRNPYARVLSCYNSKIGHKDLSLLKRARILSFYKGLEAGMRFEDFAKWLNTEEGQDQCADRHWMSQNRFLYMDGQSICDFIGKYENLEQDLETLAGKIGITPPTLSKGGWISGASNYHDIYDDQTRDLIAKRYARDIELFNYKF